MKIGKRILAISLCFILAFCVTACKKTGDTGSDYEYITSEYYIDEYIDGSDGTADDPSGDGSDGTADDPSGDGSDGTADDPSGDASGSSDESGNKTTVSNPNRVQPSGSSSSTDTSKFKNQHLKLMIKFDPKQDSDIVKGYMSGLESWMKKYNCTYEIVSSDQGNESLKAAIAAKDAPDLYYQIESFPNVVSLGLVQPIEDYIPANQKYLDEKSINEGTWAGHIYSLFVSDGTGRTYLKYNPDLFAERGVKTPREYFEEDNWTWDTFREVAKAMTKPEINLYGCSSSQFGKFGCKDIVSVAENGDVSSTLNSSWNTEFFQWVYKLYAEDKIFAPDDNAKVAMGAVQLDAEPKYDSNGKPTSYMKADGTNWEFVPFPKKPGDSTYVSHSQQFSFMVPVGAKNPAMSTSLALSMCAGWKSYVDGYKNTYCAYEKKVRDACSGATTFLYYPEVHTFLPNLFVTWDNDQFSELMTTPTATAMAKLIPIHQAECKTYNEKYN